MPTKIFLIDDDDQFKRITIIRLRSFIPDVETRTFGDITSARAFFATLNTPDYPDLVILDEHLPDGRGQELLREGALIDMAVLSMSSDDSPEIPGAVVRAGAAFFLSKSRIGDPLFKPLVLGLLERNRIQRELASAKLAAAVLETAKTLVSTLQHEINNPLGAVLGAAYLLGKRPSQTSEEKQAAELVEKSGRRIKHVLDQLCSTVSLEKVEKAEQAVFHVPGDEPWEK